MPFGQTAAMHRKAPASRALALHPGTPPWVHARVDRRQLAHSHLVERAFLQAAIRRWRASGSFRPAVFLRSRAAL